MNSLTLVTPDALEVVAGYRDAARRILRADFESDGRTTALMRLFARAKRETSADLVLRGLVEELAWEIDRHNYVAFAGPDPLAARHRRLRAAGYSACPERWSPLATEAEISRWAANRRDAAREYEAREGAVQ